MTKISFNAKPVRIAAPVLLILFLVSFALTALSLQSVQIKLPEHVHIKTHRFIKTEKQAGAEQRLYFSKSTVFPLEIVFADLFGAHVRFFIKDPADLGQLKITTAIIKNPDPAPIEIYQLPQICPRTRLVKTPDQKPALLYDATLDILNERPTLHLFDPDVRRLPFQREILKQFDHTNTLTIREVGISYDYEDNTILDFEGKNPLTGRHQIIYEGQGGFYANFHYAVVPFDQNIMRLERQELLNLAEGRLAYVEREDLTPKLRVHSFVPGPYLSSNRIYPLCEWGDTAFQSTHQQMTYSHYKIWDWDIKDTDGISYDHIIIIVWEGDEEDWLVSDGLLDPYYLTDDLVGVFEVKRADTLAPLTLTNAAGNFKMVVETSQDGQKKRSANAP
ncbi:MAG: hypothetical protein HQM16_05940 [Deltaproteobacteria bacterium]|nr:hypothetical protein [Deltaproteobacteria bacterium]